LFGLLAILSYFVEGQSLWSECCRAAH